MSSSYNSTRVQRIIGIVERLRPALEQLDRKSLLVL